MVLQTHGRDGQYNPHLHIIATSGGIEEGDGTGTGTGGGGGGENKWHHLDYLAYKVLHKKWQWHLLKRLREEVKEKSAEVSGLINECYKEYPEGFIVNVQKGDVPSRYKSLAKYLVILIIYNSIKNQKKVKNYNY